MAKKQLSLAHSEEKDGGYYRLIPPKKTIWGHIKQFLGRILLFPYHVYQVLIGRLVTYLVINPLFRKDEDNEAHIAQHPKHPDPAFENSDETTIINVIPKRNIFIRTLLNWHNFFINHTTTGKLAFSFLKWLPSGQKSVEKHFDKIVDQVEALIESGYGTPLQPNQIHLRGLDELSLEQQDLLYERLEERTHYDFRQNKNHLYFYKLQTPDNAVLDSVEVRSKGAETQDIANRRFIVTAMPRSNNFVDWIKHYLIYAKELDVTVIGFNYRGVGLSKGIVTSENDLADDAYAQVRRLLELGAKPENIALMGECIGGNIATHTAGRLHLEGSPVKLYNARSFRSLTSIIESRNRPSGEYSGWNPITWLGWVRYGLIKGIVSPIIKSAQWSLNVDKEFLAIPPHDRDFLVVRSKKDEEGKRFTDDKMVPHKHASIYSLVKKHTKELIEKNNRGEELTDEEQEWLDDVPKQHKFHVSEKLHTSAKKADGHTVLPRLLTPTNQASDEEEKVIDGRQYAINFFKRVWPEKNDLSRDESDESVNSAVSGNTFS